MQSPVFTLRYILLPGKSSTNMYYNTIHGHGFGRYVTEPTRVSEGSETLLHHVLHNNVYANLQVNVKEADLTDHFATEGIVQFNSLQPVVRR